MSTSIVDPVSTKHRSGLLSVLAREFRAVVPPTLFFFVGFNLILFTKRLFLAEYLIQYAGFLVATTSALIVGKSVLVAEKMPFLRRFDNAPLAYPILFKTLVYTLFVGIARLIEALAYYLIDGGVLANFRGLISGPCSWGLACCSCFTSQPASSTSCAVTANCSGSFLPAGRRS